MNTTLTPTPTDLVIVDLEEHLDDEVPCYRCTDTACVRVIASCCKAQRTMCALCEMEWRARVDQILQGRSFCRGCGTDIPANALDWYRVVPL